MFRCKSYSQRSQFEVTDGRFCCYIVVRYYNRLYLSWRLGLVSIFVIINLVDRNDLNT